MNDYCFGILKTFYSVSLLKSNLDGVHVAGYRYLVIYREANQHVVRQLNGRVQERYS